jgi:hypothetical protein
MAVFSGPIIAVAINASRDGKGRRKTIIKLNNANAPNVVRAHATVNGPYPRKARETTINVPPQMSPSEMIASQFARVGLGGTEGIS